MCRRGVAVRGVGAVDDNKEKSRLKVCCRKNRIKTKKNVGKSRHTQIFDQKMCKKKIVKKSTKKNADLFTCVVAGGGGGILG